MANSVIPIYVLFASWHVVLSVSTELVRNSNQCVASTCADATRFIYEIGQTYIYDYEARVTTSLEGTTDQSSGYFMQSSVHFQILSPCEFAMTMHNTKLTEVYDGADDQHDQTPHQAFQVALEEHPLRFAFHDGRIEGVCSSIPQPDWVLNVKKGVLSVFQNSMYTDERRRQKIREVDILGTCDTEYIVTHGWRATVVKKSKILDSCSDHQSTLSAIQANPFMAGTSQSLPLVHGTQECEQTITHGLLEKVECVEAHYLRPFSGEDAGGAVTRIQQSLVFNTDTDGITVQMSDVLMSTSLLFKHTVQDNFSQKHYQANNAHHALQHLCHNAQDGISQDTPTHFQVLVEQLQSLDAQRMQRLLNDVPIVCKSHKEKGRQLLLDALVQTTTPAAHHVMTQLVSQRLVADTVADWWFFNLGLQPQPKEASLLAVAPILDLPTVPASAYLGISSVIATFCRAQPSCESSPQVLRIINRLESNLGSACEVSSEQQASKIILSLKAIGNIGLPQRSPPTLQRCVNNRSLPTELRLAAIQAHRRFSCNLPRSFLLNTFLEPNEDSELRIALYLEVMRCPSKEVIDSLQHALQAETVNQVGSFVWTHLTNLQESADLCKADIQGLLADYHLQAKFSTDARKFSRAYEWSFFSEALDAGAHIDGSIVFSPKSYLPRSAMVNLTVDLFGRSINLVELTGRMEGFEETIESLFGPSGAFPSRPTKGGLRALRDKWNMDQQKLQQLSDMAHSQRSSNAKPRATAALKVFGNELKSWSLQGMQQLSQLRDAWNLQSLLTRLATDHHVETTHSAILMKGKAFLSTGTGLQLLLAINSTAVVTLSAAGHMDLRRLASRSMEIVGHLSPSGAIHVMGSMAVDGIVSQAGIELKTSLQSSTSLDGRVEIRAKDLVRIRVNMPKEKVEIIDLKSQLFVTQGQWRQEIAGVQKDRLDTSHCTGDLTGRALGIELCGRLSYPNASDTFDTPYFPLTGPFQLQFYVHKTDIGLSSFVLEYRWEKDQVSTSEGTQYQRNFLISVKTPHSVQDRELTAELIINEADRLLSCRLLSPFKKIVINGQYIFEVEHKKLEATLSIDGHQYLVTTELKTDTTDTSSRLTPRIHVRLPDGPVLSLTGFIFLELGKKLTVDLRLDHLTTRPIVLVGEVVRSERHGFRRLDWDATFGSPTIESHLQGYLQVGGGAWSATSGVEYWRPTERGGPPVQKHRIDLLAKFRNTSPPSRALTRLTATAELQMTAYPQYSAAVSWTFLNAVGHVENTFEIGLGPNARHQDHQLVLQQVLSYSGRGTQQDNNITARFSVSYPVREVHCVLRLHHRSTKHATTTEAELYLDPKRSIALEATYHDESSSLANVKGTLQLHLPTRTIRLQTSLVEQRRHEYALESEAQWKPGEPLKIKGLYRNRSTHLRLSYDLQATAVTPTGISYGVQGHFLAAENRMSIGSKILAAEGNYMMEANLTRQNRGSYNLHTAAEWPGDFYRGTANLTLGDEKVLSLDAQLGHHRRIHGEAALLNFDDLQYCTVELLWDADRDPSKKMTLNARHEQPNLGEHKGKVYFTHPQRNVTFIIYSRTYGSWHDGPLSLTSEMVLDWGRRLTLNTELQQTTGPNRQDISVLASANTPFQGFEVLHASATRSYDDDEWAIQAKIMGPAGKAVHLDSKTTQSSGSNLVETRLNVATPFEGFENVTVYAWHRDDIADVALGMESHWGHDKRMVIKAYASDTGHLHEKEYDDENEEEDINMRGGLSISTPWTGIAGADFHHHVTDALVDSKAEAHWGQQGAQDTNSNHRYSPDLKTLSVTLNSRTGQQGPNMNTQASSYIVTPLEGFEQVGAILTHATDYSGFQTSARVLWGQKGKYLNDALRIRAKGWHQSSATALNMLAEISAAAPIADFDEVGAKLHHIQDWNKLSTNLYTRWSQEGFLNASVLGHNTLDKVQGNFIAQIPWSGYKLIRGSLNHHITPHSLNSSIRASAGEEENVQHLGLSVGASWLFPEKHARRLQGIVIVETPTKELKHFTLAGSQISNDGMLQTHGDIEVNGNKAWINHDVTLKNVWHLNSQLTAGAPIPVPCSFNLTHKHMNGHLYTSLHGKWADQQEALAVLELRHEGKVNNRLLRAAVTMNTQFENFFSLGAVLEHTHLDANRTLLVEVKKNEMGTSAQGWIHLSNQLMAGNVAFLRTSHNSQVIQSIATFSGELVLKPNQRQLKVDFQFPIFAVQLLQLDASIEYRLKGVHVVHLTYEFAGNHGDITLSWLNSLENGDIKLDISSSIPNMEYIHIEKAWHWPAEAVCRSRVFVQWNNWHLDTTAQLTEKGSPRFLFHGECKALSIFAAANITCIVESCNFQGEASWNEENHEEWIATQTLLATITSSGSNSGSTVRSEMIAKGTQRMLKGEASIAKGLEITWASPWYANVRLVMQIPQRKASRETLWSTDVELSNLESLPSTNDKKINVTTIEEWQYSSYFAHKDSTLEITSNLTHKHQTSFLTIVFKHDAEKPRLTVSFDAPFTPLKTASFDALFIPNEQGLATKIVLTLGDHKHNITGDLVNVGNDAGYELRGNLNIHSTSQFFETVTVAVTVHGGASRPLEAALTASSPDQSVQVAARFKSEGIRTGEVHLVFNVPALIGPTFAFDAAYNRKAWQNFQVYLNAGLSKQWVRFMIDLQRAKTWETANITSSLTMPIQGYHDLRIHTHYIFKLWEHVEAGAEVITPFQNYQKFHLLTLLKNTISGMNSKDGILTLQSTATKYDSKWDPYGDWNFQTNLETPIDGWNKINMIASRRLSLDGTNYWQSNLHFQQLQWSTYGFAHISAFPDLTVEADIITPLESIGNVKLDLMQRLDELSYTGNFESQWSKGKKLGIHGQFTTSGVEVNVSTPFVIFPSGYTYYEYKKTNELFTAKAGASFNNELLAAVHLHLLNDIQRAKWRNSIDIHNPWQPVGLAVGATHDLQDSQYTSEFCWNLEQRATSKLTGEAFVRQTDAGREFSIETVHPYRIMKLQSRYLHTNKRFAHDARLQWESSSASVLGYALALDSKMPTSAGHPIQYEASFALTSPLRIVEMGGEVAVSMAEFGGTANILWDAGRDRTRQASINFKLQSTDNSRSSYSGHISLKHPQLEKEVALRGNVSYAIDKRDLLSLFLEADYSPHLQDRLLLAAIIINDASLQPNTGIVEASAKLVHPASGLNIQLIGNATDSPFRSIANLQLTYQDKYDTPKVSKMLGVLNKEDRYAKVQFWLPRDHWKTQVSLKQQHTSYLAVFSHHHNDDEQVFVDARIDNHVPSVNVSIFQGQERNLMYSMTSGLETSRQFVFDAVRHQLSNKIHDVLMRLTLRHPFLVNYHLKWKPTMLQDLLDNANATTRMMLEEFKSSWARFRHYIRDEAITKRRRFLATTNNAWEDFMKDIDNDLKSIQSDVDHMQESLETMYHNNHFYYRQTIEWLQDEGIDIGDLYQQFTNFIDAISKALLHQLGMMTATLLEAWDNGRDFFNDSTDNFLELILTKGSALGKSLQEQFQHLRRQTSRTLRLIVDFVAHTCQTWMSSLSSLRRFLWEKLSGMWTSLRAWGETVVQKWRQLKQVVLDTIYQLRDSFLSNPLYVNLLAWVRALQDSMSDFWSKELFAALKRHLAVVWEALIDGQNSFIGFVIRQGKWLKETVEEFGERIRNNKHVVFYSNLSKEIYQRATWVLDYYQLCDDLTYLPLRIYQAVSALTQRTGYQRGIQYDTRNRVTFSYSEGLVEIEQYLPMAWYTLSRWPQLDQLPEVRLYNKVRNVLSGSGSSFWDTFYTYQPYLTSTSTWLPPFSGYAIMAGKQHFVTFDKAFFAASGECTYLLSHDFVEENFTIAVKYESRGAQPSLVLILGDREAEVTATGKVTINGKKAELPQTVGEHYIVRQGSLIVASPARGVLLECNLAFHYCLLRVDGWYFARTTGFFGTYNNEPSDDVIPSSDSSSAMLKWEIGTGRCRSHQNRAVIASTAAYSDYICASYFENRNSIYKHCFKQVDPQPYHQMCLNDIAENQSFHEETICTATAAYVTACHMARVLLRTPRSCIRCPVSENRVIIGGDNVTLHEGQVQASSDIVLIVEAKECNQKVVPFLPELIKNVEDSLVQAGIVGNRYSVVGFGSTGVYDKPHTHTMDGDIFGSSKVVASALMNIAYGEGISDTFTALHFAANLPFRAGVSKTFLVVLCTECQQTSHWVGYQEVYRTLLEDGIHVHLLIDHEFSIRNTKDFYGLDSTRAFTVKDARTKNLRGDRDLRTRVVEPKYICIPPALESNGSVFSVHRLMDGKRRTKSFLDVFGRRVASTASPASCQRCDCVPDAFGAGKMHCQPCHNPGSAFLFGHPDFYGLDEEMAISDEDQNSAEITTTPSRQKTKGNRRNRKKKRSRGPKTQKPQISNVTESTSLNWFME